MKTLLHILGMVLLVQLTGCATTATAPAPVQPGAIGAQLRIDDGRVAVASILPGSVAEQNGDLQPGDRIVAVASPPSAQPVAMTSSIGQAVSMIRGTPGTQVRLQVQTPGVDGTRDIVLVRGYQGQASAATLLANQAIASTPEAAAADISALVIPNNSGQYMSPYTSDAVTAEWVDKAINAKMGSAAGSAVGAAAGAYAGRKAFENIPGGSLFGSFMGGMAGSKAGKSMGRDAAIAASGGWDYIRATSDQSFQSVQHMARWLVATHGGNPNFQEVINATLQIYPDLQPALAQAR